MHCLKKFYDAENSADSKKCYLEFRYWLRLPSGEYAFDVNCVLELITSRIVSKGVNASNPLLRFEEEYLCARGVRIFRIALSEEQTAVLDEKFFRNGKVISGKGGIESAKRTQSKDELYLRFRVAGKRKDGRCFTAYQVFKPADSRNGYRFASIRKTSCLNLDLKDVGGIEYMLSNHFEKLYRCYSGDYPELPTTSVSKELIPAGQIRPSAYDRFSRLLHYSSYRLQEFRRS